MDWYFRTDRGRVAGPLGEDDLRWRASSGVVRPETPVRLGEAGAWRLAGDVAGLFPEPPARRARLPAPAPARAEPDSDDEEPDDRPARAPRRNPARRPRTAPPWLVWGGAAAGVLAVLLVAGLVAARRFGEPRLDLSSEPARVASLRRMLAAMSDSAKGEFLLDLAMLMREPAPGRPDTDCERWRDADGLTAAQIRARAASKLTRGQREFFEKARARGRDAGQPPQFAPPAPRGPGG